MLISIPAAVGIAVLADPVCNLLFISEDNSLLIRLTMAGSLAVVFFSLSTVTNAVLQGLNHMEVPVRHAAVSLVIHVAVLWVFLMIFHIGIYGVVFANIVFAFVMCILNARTIARALDLNETLTEAIALGHDLGHTPFGHAGDEC